MHAETFGARENPTVVLLHGGGLGWWAYRDAAMLLAQDYHVVLPSIHGYGDAADESFESIQASARAFIRDIDAEYQGKVFALGGLSLGAQIAVEMLSQRPDVAEYAVLESALVFPLPAARWLGPIAGMSYRLIQRRWFARMQAKALALPDALFAEYYRDSLRLSKQTLCNTVASNGSYRLSPNLSQVKAKALVIVGEKELPVMRHSAEALCQALPQARLWVADGMAHGEASLKYPETYVDEIRALIAGNETPQP